MRDRALDGHINRALEGKTVLGVTKDGTLMTIHCTNGERWNIGWADFSAGRGFSGEPAVVSINDLRDVSEHIDAADGSVHKALCSKVIESARTDGEVLYLSCVGGTRYGVAWIDPTTLQRVRAEPCLVKVDARVLVDGVSAFGEARM